ncbi:SH3 domain-containing protein [Pleurostoma richardsiae]|uniref:SH3 domain-containing protein n=1 Tax=Pleurostoma richardsiae TaxID=41990 RepID=A0AA38VX51_9PEZI|nr:SH3 domain-containing protein [Pleurostoma richardsiae]
MPAVTNDAPSVALSFANNFWGKEDAGVGPLLERMHAAKVTSDELKSFYNARASIEDDYARKLLSLCRKSLGSQEMGSLKTSLDTVRGEVESMAKQHQNIAAQMKSELEEPLAAFAGGMKERRKIIQNGIEKLLKVKVQQTQHVNKTRDRYEQECLKIKGYLAQGHMVMGQEERKNKAKLEKTQIALATSNTEYENAVKALEETTARWNREWKAAADKFQDLEEERLDFTKSSLWTFANIASTVCVSDDASCEKIRVSLEKMDVEKDIMSFIKERGTGQEIPDPPKYINFCRGDVDSQSETSEDEHYSVAQFPRSINPAFRSSSPQPSTFESHHDPSSALAKDLGHGDPGTPPSREQTMTPQKMALPVMAPQERMRPMAPDGYQLPPQTRPQYDPNDFAPVPHDPYPMDGMTMLCRTGPNPLNPTGSELSQVSSRSGQSSQRPLSRDEHSDYSNPTSFSSQEPPSGKTSPVKQDPVIPPAGERKVLKKKSGFFQNHSPFRRKSTKDVGAAANNRNTWHAPSGGASPSRPQLYGGDAQNQGLLGERTASPDPIDANATLALNVGNNVFPVSTSDRQKAANDQPAQEDDPIAQALAELKGVTVGKQSSLRVSADYYHGIATPAPGAQPFSRSMPPGGGNSAVTAAMRGTPPPSYDQQVQRLGVPSPAVTSKAMKETSQKYTQQTRSMFGSPADRPGSGSYGTPSRPGTRGNDMPRAASPAPPRSVSPRPGMDPRQSQHRSASPNPYSGSQRMGSSQASMSQKRGSDQGYYRQMSPNDMGRGSADMTRAASPSPYRNAEYGRPGSSHMSNNGDMAMQLSPAPEENYGGSMRGRGGGGRPGTSSGQRGMSLYEGSGPVQPASRTRSKSVADQGRQYARDGRPIMHFARALYMYQAAIPEELGFSKGDVLAILRHQDDGWWEAEIHGGSGRVGLVPSNYLQPC